MGIKEWFKSKPYWLKGGFFGLFFSVVLIILTTLWGILTVGHGTISGPIDWFLFRIIRVAIIIMSLVGIDNERVSDVWFFIFVALFYSLIGSLTGFVYGKIKSKK